MRNLVTVLAPLYKLLKWEESWTWEEAFQKSKDLLLSSEVLVHFDPELEIWVACDASDWRCALVQDAGWQRNQWGLCLE